jgi:hypothetical protein
MPTQWIWHQPSHGYKLIFEKRVAVTTAAEKPLAKYTDLELLVTGMALLMAGALVAASCLGSLRRSPMGDFEVTAGNIILIVAGLLGMLVNFVGEAILAFWGRQANDVGRSGCSHAEATF